MEHTCPSGIRTVSDDQRSGTSAARASCGRPARSAHGEGSGPEGPNELVQPVVRVVPAVIAAALAQLLRPPPQIADKTILLSGSLSSAGGGNAARGR